MPRCDPVVGVDGKFRKTRNKGRLTSSCGMKTLSKMAVSRKIQIRWPFRKLWQNPLLEGIVGKLGLAGDPVAAGWGYRPSGRAAQAQSQSRGAH